MFKVSYEDFIGNKREFKKVEECILSKKPVLIWGPPGIGKTTSVRVIAEKYGYSIVELNSSDSRRKEDLEKILKDVQMKALRPKIFLFDEVDGMGWMDGKSNFNILAKIIDVSKHPIAMTANDIRKIPEFIQKRCEVVRFFPPSKREILQLIKKLFGDSPNLNYDRISNDVRNSIINVLAGSEPYEVTDPYTEVANIFRGKEFRFDNSVLWIWLIDNVDRFYSGRALFEAIKIIADAAYYDNPRLLKALPKSNKLAKPMYPYFLERKKALEGGSDR